MNNDNKTVCVKIFDFDTNDQVHGKSFNKSDFLEFINEPITKQNLYDGKYNCLLTHAGRIYYDEPLYEQYIAPEDKALNSKELVGIITDLYIKNNSAYADIKLLKTTESAKLINELIDMEAKVGVSICFRDCGTSYNFKIHTLEGVDFTLSPAMRESYIQ